MEDIREIVKEDKPEFYNFIAVYFAMISTLNGLQEYVEDILESVKKDVYTKTAGRPNCSQNCSKTHGREFKQWCSTCAAWKQELKKFVRSTTHWHNIKWDTIDSQAWSYSIQEISKCFLKDPATIGKTVSGFGVLKDLSNLMSLFRNLKTCDIDIKNTIDRVSDVRNKHFGHNFSARVFQPDKIYCIDALSDLLSHPSVKCFESSRSSVKFLSNLKHSNDLVENIFVSNFQLKRDCTEILSKAKENEILSEEDIASFKCVLNKIYQQNRIMNKEETDYRKHTFIRNFPFKLVIKTIFCLLIVLLLAILAMNGLPLTKDENIIEGCLTITLHSKFQTAVKFDKHIEYLANESFIERSWLVPILEKRLQTSKKSILLTAEMGYGKSTLVANVLCAKPTSAWYQFRQQIISYHICRFNYKLLSNPDVFIKNLGGMIIAKIPELGNLILSDDNAMQFLNSKQLCRDDPDSCLEATILHPLKGKFYERQLLIIIDALDECNTNDYNKLPKFLFRHLGTFPIFIKFIFTSRNLQEILQFDLEHIQLEDFRRSNFEDISLFLKTKTNMHKKEVDNFLYMTNANFLFTKLYLHLVNHSSIRNLNKIPKSLGEIYELNFQRVFADPSKFDKFRNVFEILCAAYKPMTEDTILNIISNARLADKYEILILIGNDLRHFVRRTKNEITLIHQSLGDFLTNSSRRHLTFYVEKENGHWLMANYLLNKSSISNSNDVIEIVHHVSMVSQSKENLLVDKLLNAFNISNQNTNSNTSLMHTAVREIDSYETIKLLHQLTSEGSENVKDQENGTPLFSASKIGHSKSLRALLDIGANPNITVGVSRYTSSHMKRIDLVFICKYIIFCGYNILHIASQNGHIDVVKVLVKRLPYLLLSKTQMNLTAFNLAAENGHLEVLRILLNHEKKLSDFTSLHHASQNGHDRIVNFILENGIRDACLPCNNSFYWISHNTSRKQNKVEQFFQNLNDQVQTDNVYDDWHLIACETALESAVRNGHLSIVKMLLNYDNTSIHCNNYSGRSILMTAIMYNHTDIFKYLHSIGANFSMECTNKFSFTKHSYYLGKSDTQLLLDEQCTDGATIPHFLSAYGNLDMLLYSLDKVQIQNWIRFDKTNATPLHYAFCSSNIYFIYIGLRKDFFNLNFLSRTRNGSTPYHSCAACASLTFYLMKSISNDSKIMKIPDVHDLNGRSILHYGLQGHEPSENHKNWFLGLFVDILALSKHDFTHIDKYGQNFMHYASESGAYYAIQDGTHRLSKEHMSILLLQKDKHGLTPLDVAFRALTKKTVIEPLNLQGNCSLAFLFTSKCGCNYSDLLSPHEMCILVILQKVFNLNSSNHFNFEKLATIAATKSRIYPILMIRIYANEFFLRLVESSSVVHNILHLYKGPFLVNFVLTKSNCLKCNSSGLSPLHSIIMNERNRNWMHSSFELLEEFLRHYPSTYLDTCFDKNGYNLLHTAAIGGNIIAMEYLYRKGMKINQITLQNTTVLEICISHSPYLHHGKPPDYYFDHGSYSVLRYKSGHMTEDNFVPELLITDHDSTAVFILNRTMLYISELERKSLKDQLCGSSSKVALNLIHIAAARGMILFLKTCKTFFGLEILQCLNSDSITPYYLASLTKQTGVMKWFRELEINLVLPNVLIHNVLTHTMIESSKFMDWTCQIQYSLRYSALARVKMIKCLNGYRSSSLKTMTNSFDFISIFKMNTLWICLSTWIKYESKGIENRLNEKAEFLSKAIRKECNEIPKNRGETLVDSTVSLMCSKSIRCLSITVLYNNRVRKSFKNIWRNVYNIYERYLYFGLDEQFFVHQLFCNNTNMSFANKKCITYPFWLTTINRFRYMNLLKERHDLHGLWLKQQFHLDNFEQIDNYIEFEITLSKKQEKQLTYNIYTAVNAFKSLQKHIADTLSDVKHSNDAIKMIKLLSNE